MTFIECVNTRYVNGLYTVVFPKNTGELHNLYATPNPSLCVKGLAAQTKLTKNIGCLSSQALTNTGWLVRL